MKISEAVKLYEIHLKAKKRAKNTCVNYLATINRFIIFCRFEYVKDITPDSIAMFRNYIDENGVGGESNNIYLAALRSFFKYLYQAEHLTKDYSALEICENYKKNIAESVRGKHQSIECDDEDGKVIRKEHRKLIIKTALKNIRKCGKLESSEGERNAVMLEIAFICGMRISDLVDLKVKNFFIDEKKSEELEKQIWKLKFFSKKPKKWVEFYVCNDKLIDKLQSYIQKNNLSLHSFLFPTSKSEYMSTTRFWQMFESILKAAELPAGKENNGYAPHDMRRTCATELYYKRIPLKEISRRLGHASVEMTERYLRLNDTEENIETMTKALVSLI